jgi:hypothetical protein
MQEIFWFFLGGFVYLILDKINSFFKKVKFIHEVKIYAFKLIGVAYEQLIFAMTLKYISLEESNVDEEKIKLYRNTDEAAFLEWKRETIVGMKESLPPIYRSALEVEEWKDIMNMLDTHYKEVLHSIRKKENE